MNPILIVVVTRLHTDPNVGTDEFRTDWQSDDAEHGRFFRLDDKQKIALLLVHGHSAARKDLAKAVELAQLEIAQEDQEYLKHIAVDADIKCFVHGDLQGANDESQKSNRERSPETWCVGARKIETDASCDTYTSLRWGSASLGFLHVLHEAYSEEPGIGQRLCDEISQKCLDPARIQSLYLNQVRELLLALQLSTVVVGGEHATEDHTNALTEDVLAISKQIRECLHRPVVMTLVSDLLQEQTARYPRSPVDRLMAIWDVDNEDAQSMYRRDSRWNDFEGFDPAWESDAFWGIVADPPDRLPEVLGTRLSALDSEKVATDFRHLALGVDVLLEAAASGRGRG